jgi:hypothetical protein
MGFNLLKRPRHAIRWWLLHHLPTCKQMAPVMSESLERRLTLRERVILKLHLWVCIWCVWYLEQLQMMRKTLREGSSDISDNNSSESSLTAEARERLKRALRDHQ